MKRPSAWDVVGGALLTLLVTGAYWFSLPLFENAELQLYDMRAKLRQNLDPSEEIVLVAIDDNSIAQIGPWPWPRWRLAAVIDKLSSAGARVVGLDIVLSAEERNPGLAELRRLKELYQSMVAARAVTDRKNIFDVQFSSAIVELDSDSKLEIALRKAGNVVLPMSFARAGTPGAALEPPPAWISTFTLSSQGRAQAVESAGFEGGQARFPVARFAAACAGIGHVNVFPDLDGVVRREMPAYRYGNDYYPSFGAQLALAYGGLRTRDAVFVPGRELRVGNNSIPLDETGRMLVTYNGPEQTFQTFSFQDVINDKVPPDALKNKIVIVGPASGDVAASHETPLAVNFPAIEMVANVVENILHGKYLLRPPWARKLELGLLGAAGLFVMLLLPRLRALPGLILSLLLMVSVTAAGTYFFVNGCWVKVAYPSILLALSYLIGVLRRLFATARGAGAAEASAAGPKPKAAGPGVVAAGAGAAPKESKAPVCGAAPKRALGRYQIEKELGRGAMGVVYLGRDPKINRRVAIKTMALEAGADAAATREIKERFFREAESAGTLNHPNIVRIFDAGEEQDVAFIAMELLDGHDFTRYTAKDSLLPVAQTMEYVAMVADALDYAHARGIVHRDIKPANFMLLQDGTVRVADFGIARITASSKTTTGAVLGTPSYMSPEQVAGKKVDGRSDIFSLSVALFELATGEKPFKGGEGIGTLLFQITNEPHPDPLAVRPDLPACLAPIIHKGLAKNPDERYARGGLLAAELRACVSALKSGGAARDSTVRLPPPAGAPAADSIMDAAAPLPAPGASAAAPVLLPPPAATEPAPQATVRLAAAEQEKP